MTETINPDFVLKYGTPVLCGTERYVLELPALDDAVPFTNPTDNGKQMLKGNGRDILLINSITPEQQKTLDIYLDRFEHQHGKPAEQMNVKEVIDFLTFLERNNFNDRYCSHIDYKNAQLVKSHGRMYRRTKDVYYAATLEKGMSFQKNDESGNTPILYQEATRNGAVFVTNGTSSHIDNVGSYQPVKPGDKIISYKETEKAAKKDRMKAYLQQQSRRNGMRR